MKVRRMWRLGILIGGWTWLAAWSSSTAGLVWADRIVFETGEELSGQTIRVLSEENDEVKIRTAYGTLVFPKEQIKTIEIDPELHRTETTGPRGKLEVLLENARRHVRQEQWAEAAELYREVLKVPKVSDRILLEIAEFGEGHRHTDLAKAAYERLLQQRPDRADIRAKLRALARRIEEEGLEELTTPPKGATPDDGLEIKGWARQPWGNAAEVTWVRRKEGPANWMLRVTFKANTRGKSALALPLKFRVEQNRAISFKVQNRTYEAIPVAVAVKTLPKWAFHESEQKVVGPRKTMEVRFDLTSRDWKSAATGWKHAIGLRDEDQIGEVVLMIYNRRRGEIYVDDLQAGPKKAAPKGAGKAK